MNVQTISPLSTYPPPANGPSPGGVLQAADGNGNVDEEKLHDVFNQFVGETFFGQLIKSMRSTLDKPAYFHGGRAEEVFQGQLDQMLSEQMAETSSEQIAAPMYELFQLNRQR
jgi:Rod binding domain-containing protein